ncbi:MAG: BlaI/MecI/CopY family transcriptional regulator [Nitrososphaerota archaeon]|jgi:hypothetical protein|nr:BlaI/MecI/CopY family transcriptional regulator [Nitrososphaerota archaeon]
MPARKMRVEIFDNDGGRYAVTIDSQITRDKALRMLEIHALLGGMPNESQSINSSNQNSSNLTSRFEKVQVVIQKSFPLSCWFASKDIQTFYEQEFKEPISLSTVSTYLARMVNKGLLIRTGTGNSVKYKAANLAQTAIKQQIKNNY